MGPTLKEQGEMDVQTGHRAEREADKASWETVNPDRGLRRAFWEGDT